MKYILQCPRCKNVLNWERKSESDGPGNCECGAWAYWKVLKEMPPECPICGHHHSDRMTCEDDGGDYQIPWRDWGDL